MVEVKIPCSPEQEEIIFDHAINNGPLGILPDERAWILNNVRKLGHHGKIQSADLDLTEAQWVVSIQ